MKFTVSKNALLPEDDEARAVLAKAKIGALLDVQMLNPMNMKFNAKIHACIDKLARATGVDHESMQARLMLLTGRFKQVPVTAHKKVTCIDSMSRSAMTDSERESFWQDMQEVARETLLPFIDDRLAAEIEQMFDPPPQDQQERKA